jgi:hypothetical protein
MLCTVAVTTGDSNDVWGIKNRDPHIFYHSTRWRCVGHFAVMEEELVMTGKKLSGSPSRLDVVAKRGYRVLPGHPSQ